MVATSSMCGALKPSDKEALEDFGLDIGGVRHRWTSQLSYARRCSHPEFSGRHLFGGCEQAPSSVLSDAPSTIYQGLHFTRCAVPRLVSQKLICFGNPLAVSVRPYAG